MVDYFDHPQVQRENEPSVLKTYQKSYNREQNDKRFHKIE